jgi:hypothetical protein
MKQQYYNLNTTNYPRQVVFLLNNTWLLVSVQYVRRIYIYSVDLMTNIFQYNQSIVLPFINHELVETPIIAAS